MHKILPLGVVTFFFLAACSTTTSLPTATASAPPSAVEITTTLPPSAPPRPTASPSQTPPPSPTASLTPIAPPLALNVADFEPAGCRAPVEDYTQVPVNGWTLNQRTLSMLHYAAELYGGPIDIANAAITQGSYSDNGPASFGTHLGGGAVDISVVEKGSVRRVLYTELEALIRALRVAGFAAWVRDYNELSTGSPIHIHAIAIGDKELSEAAQAQLTGTFGYFYGYSGVPQDSGVPVPDRHSGPIVCAWMKALGYAAPTTLAAPTALTPPPPLWQTRLRAAAERYIVTTMTDTQHIAREIDFRPGPNEDASNMCGPLAGAILRDAGLLPPGIGPWNQMKNFWLADPEGDGRPWTFFDRREYELFHFDTATNQFDFSAWPLLPSDFVYTYQGKDGYEHMFIVTEVDAQGRAFSVTNNKRDETTYVAEKVILYDPANAAVGVFKNEWASSPKIGRTGMKGFDVMRRKGVSLPRGTLYPYVVRPGDTLPLLAIRFQTTLDAILSVNALSDPAHLDVGQMVQIPVNSQLSK